MGLTMFKNYMDLLVCPKCHGKLEWNIEKETIDRIVDAKIQCTNCGSEYEVKDEIAVFLTDIMDRNDLWEMAEEGVVKYFKEKPSLFEALDKADESALNGADLWYKASYYEALGDYEKSIPQFNIAMEKIYTNEYNDAWNSQINYVANKAKKESMVVDIASGKGYLVKKLIESGTKHVIVTDFSPTILKRNKAYYKHLKCYDQLSLIAFDARLTPFKDHSIKCMTSNVGIMNIENSGEVASELKRILSGDFYSIMQFIDEADKKNLRVFEDYGNTVFALEKSAVRAFEDKNYGVAVENKINAFSRPTPIGQLVEGASVDGFPVCDTNIKFCVMKVNKK